MHGITMINIIISLKRTLLSEIQSSEIEWIGHIPRQWKIKRGKFLFRNIKELNANNDSNILSLTLRGVVNNDPDNPEGQVPNDYTTYQIFEKNDLVFKLIDLENYKTSRVGIVPEKGIMSSAYIRLVSCHSGVQRYFYLQYFDLYQRGIFNQLGGGVRSTLSSIDLLEIPILQPSNEEQSAIVKYLDYADQIVRGGVSRKLELVELMEEYKRAVIQQTVTRGLDPDVPLKPSGVEWLGDIPEHWEVRRLRTVTDMRVSNVDKHANDDEISVRLCNYVDVYKNDLVDGTIDFMPATATEDEISRFHLRIGDVLITKDSETWDDIGVPALVAETTPDLVSGYHLALLRPDTTQLLGSYLFRALQSRAVAHQFHVEARGVTRYGLSHSGILSVAIPLPPVEEQAAIVAHLDKLTSDIDVAIAHTRREIELLEEYRTRLIADVVTGKLDVREAAANLPDVNLDDLQPLAEGDEADD